ncbi:MAG: hypothetical protein [Microviridae sp.]|nr:MAG: hypothetical protein [Microviridae sp.]
MYKIPRYDETTMELDNTRKGETIEDKVIRLIANKEPIKDGVPIIFQDRKEGVNAAYNIRTDRWEIAIDAMTRLEKAKAAKRDEIAKTPEQEAKVVEMKNNKDGRPESAQGTA